MTDPQEAQPLTERGAALKAADIEFKKSLKGLNAEIQNLSKAPFRQILAEMLGCKPDPESLKEFANKAPDRWAQAVIIMAKNAGYESKTTVEHNFSIVIGQMSDSQLFAELRKTEEDLKTLMHTQPVLEHQPTTS